MSTENRTLYDRGRGHNKQVERLTPTRGNRAAVAAVAEVAGEGVKEVRIALDFFRSVEAVTGAAPGAREAILDGGHPHLTPRVVARLAALSCDKVSAAIARAASGLHPLAPDPPPGLPPDSAPWHYDRSRLAAARALLERAAGGVRPGSPLAAADRVDLIVHAAAIRAGLDALRPALGGRRRPPTAAPPRVGAAGSDAARLAARARRLVEAVAGDLPRAAHARPPARAARDWLARAARAVAAAADTLRTGFPASFEPVATPGVKRRPGGPSDAKGTYVVVLRAENAGVVRVGRLGSFLLPAGHLLYVGSAFQAGGVKGRTGRHLGGTGPRLWGVDDMRGFAAPVGLWWTHHPAKVECAWARALAGMPRYCCPAPLAGASDCNRDRRPHGEGGPVQRCPAHLFHTPGDPSIGEFAEQLGRCGSGGYAIFHRAVPQTPRGATPAKPRPPSGQNPAPFMQLW